jgi:MscS family membrane protein
MIRNSMAFLMFAAALIVAAGVHAQEAANTPEEPDVPMDEFDRGTPQRSAEAFVRALDQGAYETAAEYLDLRNVRGEAKDLTGPQLARRFEVVIQRADWADVPQLVDDPMGRQNDGVPEYRDVIGRVMYNGEPVPLYMQRVPRGDGVFIWKVSNATVSQIPALYQEYGYPELIEELRRALPKVSFLGYALFKWVAALSVGTFVYASVFLIALVVRKAMGDPDMPSHRRIFRFLMVPFGVWAVVLSMNLVATSLGRGVTAEAIARVSPLNVFVTVWVLFAFANLFRDLYAGRMRAAGKFGAEVLVRPAANALKLLIAVAGTLVYMEQLGVNITTVLAGLGVGGVAVALALQKPMEDVFGAITLYSQQPVRVGDFCRFAEFTGTIEEIGLRTTKVRTLANTVVAVPNAQLANEAIDNISARQKILYWPRLRLSYDTPPETIRLLLKRIRELLADHDRVLDDTCRVRFVEIGEDSLQIEIFAHIDTTDWGEFLELKEELNLKVLEVVAESGTGLALPASTLKIEEGSVAILPVEEERG